VFFKRSFVFWSTKLRILVNEASYPGQRSFVSWSTKLRILVNEASYPESGVSHTRLERTGQKGLKRGIFDDFRGFWIGELCFGTGWLGFGAGWRILRTARRLGKA
jgi:hypothetical protein